MSAAPPDPVHVVAGALLDADARVLIAERPRGRHLAGGWEFPGGKLAPQETPIEGLARELSEELGIALGSARPLIRVRYDYPDRSILLDVWLVTAYAGVPEGLEGQRLRWCGAEELPAADLLPADRPVVAALRLPPRLVAASSGIHVIRAAATAGRHGGRLEGIWCNGAAQARAAAAAGADFLVLCDALDAAELAALCNSVNVPVFARGIALEQAWTLGATGINAI